MANFILYLCTSLNVQNVMPIVDDKIDDIQEALFEHRRWG